MAALSRFYDGKKAVAQQVELVFYNSAVSGKDATDASLFRWSYADIHVYQAATDHKQAIVGSTQDSAARLYLEAMDWQRLVSFLPSQQKRTFHKLISLQVISILLALVIVFIGLSFSAFNYLVKPIAARIPVEWAQQVGQYAIVELIGDASVCVAEDGLRVVDKMLQRLAITNSETESIDVTIVAMPMVNAFATPGNQLVLMQGLIAQAESAEEVAGVIAHELGHIYHNHPLEGLVRHLGFSLLVSLMFGNFGDMETLFSTAEILVILDYSRAAEHEADQFAVTRLQQGKIEIQGMIDFFQRMQQQSAGDYEKLYSFISTHPSTDERINFLSQWKQNSVIEPLLSEKDWQALKNICNQKKQYNPT